MYGLKQLILNISVFVGCFAFLCGEEIVLEASNGETYVMDVGLDESFFSVIKQIENSIVEVDGEVSSQFTMQIESDGTKIVRASYTGERNYWAGLSDEDNRDITYIVTTLGNGSLATIAKSRKSLKSAGSRVQHVHPFRFLQCVFGTEENKAATHNVRNRGWIWNEFFGGIKTSLENESKRNNLSIEAINDFSRNLGIDPNAIIPSIQQRKWGQLVDLLIQIVPRQGDSNRYDM